MKIAFMGTPEFARRPLEYLYQSARHEIVMVVTGADKPAGRGRKMVPTAVKKAARDLNLPVLTPQSLKDDNFIEKMKSAGADIFVVVAFRILPEKLFTIPLYGSINLHGSLLPKYRGAAPINWAIINGEKETGLTTFFLKKKVDTGNVIFQEKIAIGKNETYDELYIRMAELAGPVIEKTLELIVSGKAEPAEQDESQATPAPKLSPFDGLIDWGFPAENVVNFIRGLSTTPGAYTTFRGKKLKIFKAEKANMEKLEELRPGRIIEDKRKLLVAVSGGVVEILDLLPEGKKRMTGEQFIMGYRPDRAIFGDKD